MDSQTTSEQQESIFIIDRVQNGDRNQAQWKAIQDLRLKTKFVDYAQSETFIEDRHAMEHYAASESPPSLQPLHRGTSLTISESLQIKNLQVVRDILGLTFGIQGYKTFHNHRVCLKSIPSMGGRHGLEVYVIFPHAWMPSVSNSYYYFDPFSREFVSLAPMTPPINAVQTPMIIISCVFERYQWRYRNAWVYQCIWLDLGHALAHLSEVSAQRNITWVWHLENIAYAQSQPFVPFINEPLVSGYFQFPKE